MQVLAPERKMATCSEFVEQQIKKAKIAAIKERILSWIEKLENGDAVLVDLLETPEMRAESCAMYAPYCLTGNVDVVLKLGKVTGITGKLINPSVSKDTPNNCTVE